VDDAQARVHLTGTQSLRRETALTVCCFKMVVGPPVSIPASNGNVPFTHMSTLDALQASLAYIQGIDTQRRSQWFLFPNSHWQLRCTIYAYAWGPLTSLS
jgi:hypothetical protein